MTSRPTPRLLLINPNTNASTTAAMVAIARDAIKSSGAVGSIEGATAAFGAAMITDEAALSDGARAVAEIVEAAARDTPRPDGILVAAFGDPGFEAAETWFPGRTAGIGESGVRAAADGGRRFAVATTTPRLVAATARRVQQLGLGAQFAGTWITPGDPWVLTADPVALEAALGLAVQAAIEEGGAEAVVIGGGPLAVAARALAPQFRIPLIEPVPAAVRRLLTLLRDDV